MFLFTNSICQNSRCLKKTAQTSFLKPFGEPKNSFHKRRPCLFSLRLYAEAATGGVLIKKGVLKNFANFTGKHMC